MKYLKTFESFESLNESEFDGAAIRDVVDIIEDARSYAEENDDKKLEQYIKLFDNEQLSEKEASAFMNYWDEILDDDRFSEEEYLDDDGELKYNEEEFQDLTNEGIFDVFRSAKSLRTKNPEKYADKYEEQLNIIKTKSNQNMVYTTAGGKYDLEKDSDKARKYVEYFIDNPDTKYVKWEEKKQEWVAAGGKFQHIN